MQYLFGAIAIYEATEFGFQFKLYKTSSRKESRAKLIVWSRKRYGFFTCQRNILKLILCMRGHIDYFQISMTQEVKHVKDLNYWNYFFLTFVKIFPLVPAIFPISIWKYHIAVHAVLGPVIHVFQMLVIDLRGFGVTF